MGSRLAWAPRRWARGSRSSAKRTRLQTPASCAPHLPPFKRARPARLDSPALPLSLLSLDTRRRPPRAVLC